MPPPRRPIVFTRRRIAIIAAGKKNAAPYATSSQTLVQVASSSGPAATPLWQNPMVICLALAALLAGILLRTRRVKPAIVEFPDPDITDPTLNTDPRTYARSLARTRQAAHITGAVSLLSKGEPARAYAELTRALQENSICRRPFNSGTISKEDVVKLYELAIRSGDMPPHFPTLLQLQEMLGLSQEEAERLELDIVESSVSFSI